MSQSGGVTDVQLGHAIDALRARVDEEFRISERLDAKARQAFALSAIFFAAVQTVAFGSFAQREVSSLDRFMLLAALVAAAGGLVAVANHVRTSEALRPEADTKPEAIERWCREHPANVSGHLVGEMVRVARSRCESNETRAKAFLKVETATRFTLILVGVELFAAIAVRI